MRIDRDRLNTLTRLLVRAGLKAVLELELHDPQYRSVERVTRAHGPGTAALLAALNALVSYRLAMKGEEWWECWSQYMASRPIRSPDEAVRAEAYFLQDCRGSIIGREAKMRRLKRAVSGAWSSLERLYSRPESIFEGGRWLVEALARALGARRWSKTIVFSAKMAYYAVKPLYPARPAPGDVEIPVDVRVACFLYSTGIIEAPSYRDIVRRPSTAQEAVRIISEETRIPPLNLDTIFWRIGWIPRDVPEGISKAVRAELRCCFPNDIIEGISSLIVKRCS